MSTPRPQARQRPARRPAPTAPNAPNAPNAPEYGATCAPAWIIAIAFGFLIAGCSSTDRTRSGFLEPYRISIPQGNYVDQQMLDQVREGMSREQVKLALGSPLLTDAFHPERWDYIFRFQYANGETQLRRVTIRFNDDRVSAIKSDPLPARDDESDPALPGYQKKEEKVS